MTTVLFALGVCASIGSDAADTGSELVAPRSLPDSAAARRGELLFLQCRACHSLNRDDSHRVGPNLAGLFGSVAGMRQGFVYSEGMAASGLVWTEETLDRFLTRPNDLFPGTKMAFGGMSDAEDRRLLIAYIGAQVGD